MNSQAQERLGVPDPEARRVAGADCSHGVQNPGDVVLDPFCGCGTAIHAAEKLGRQWIGIDVTHLAIALIEKRLTDAFPGIPYEVHGTPKDLASARDSPCATSTSSSGGQSRSWGAVPFAGKKKGANSGIDGIVWFKPDGKTKEKAIVSVKGGGGSGSAWSGT